MATVGLNALLCTLPLLLTSSIVTAQQGDGGAASGNIVTAGNGDAAGASGSSTGIVKLSTGAIVAIVVVVCIVVILGILSAVLFYQAKKRQWTIKETIRRSTRRVTTGLKTAMSPLTPGKASFSPTASRSKSRGLRGPSPLRKGEKNHGIGFDVDMESLTGKGKSRDLEKGEGSRVTVEQKMRRVEEQMKNKTKPSSNDNNTRNISLNTQNNTTTTSAAAAPAPRFIKPEPSPIHPADNSDAVSAISSISSISSRRGSLNRNPSANQRPTKPSVNVPKTGRVVEPVPKTPVFNRMFGRD